VAHNARGCTVVPVNSHSDTGTHPHKRDLALRTPRRSPRSPVVVVTVLALVLGLAVISSPVPASARTPLSMTAGSAHGLYPSYRPEVRDYAMFACSGKSVKLRFNRTVRVNGRHGQTHTVKTDLHQALLLRVEEGGRTTTHTLRCLPDTHPRLSFRPGAEKLDGLVLLVEDNPSWVGLVDPNGVPLWYRFLPPGVRLSMARMNERAQLDFLLEFESLDDPANDRNLLASVSTGLVTMDLDNRRIRSIRPTENGEFIPVDYHFFASDAQGGVYFLSSWIRTVEDLPGIFRTPTPGRPQDQQRLVDSCGKAQRWKAVGARVVRADGKGRVTWRLDFPESLNRDSRYEVRWIGKEDGVVTCYYEVHHPNSVSIDPSGERIYVSLKFTEGQFAVDVATKRIVWSLGQERPGSLQISGDPLGRPTGMHSGSMNTKNEFLVFDNRSLDSEVGRAVIYRITGAGEAVFVRSFLPPRDRCTTTGGKTYCPTRVMGNASFAYNGSVMVNWGDKDGNPNIATLFDKQGKVLLDIRDESRGTLVYKTDYVPSMLEGKPLVSLDRVLRGTNATNVRLTERDLRT
jgi:hypothetical protein